VAKTRAEAKELRLAIEAAEIADEAAAARYWGFPTNLLPEGMTPNAFGNLVWGVGPEGARALIGARSAEELRALGVGLDVAKAQEFRRFYLNVYM
jgi:hypothetical protein